MNRKITSPHFPYIPMYLYVRHRKENIEALLDTGFDGDLAVPPDFIANSEPPDGYSRWRMADGSKILVPFYVGTVRVGKARELSIVVTALGDEIIVGRGITDRFTIILDHGKRLIVKP